MAFEHTSQASGLRVTVLGCAGTHSSATSACSSYLVQSEGAKVLLDAGPGSSIELQRHVDLSELDAIVVSHEHPDHWTELPSMYHAFRYMLNQRIPVYGTAGTRTCLVGATPECCDTAFDWVDINAESELIIADQRWSFSLTDHPVETLAAYIEANGSTLAYSSDTGPGWSPVQFDKPIDLMLYEASLTVEMEPSDIPHVSGRQAAERAIAAGVKSLVLTHVPPGHDPDVRFDDAKAVFTGPLHLAAPGATFHA